MSRAALAASALAGAAVLTGSARPAGNAPPSSIARLVGQQIMTGIDGSTPGPGLLARIRAGEVGGVILFGRNIGSPDALERTISELQRAAAAGGNPPLLIAVDQEGGAVRRLAAGPPDLSPAAIGAVGSASKARAEGKATADYLRPLGIDLDLAPVLDTPYGPGSWLGTRAFSRDAQVNERLGRAFVAGLQEGRVAATAKHFPGLGTAHATTDEHDVVLTTSARSLNTRLAPFEGAIGAGVDLVMVSNAGYLAYDPTGVPAVLSRPIVTGLLRTKLGFGGVVISDALEAPGPSSRSSAAVKASAAGVDVLLYTNEADSAAAFGELVAAVRSGALPRGGVQAAWTRIQALKQRLARP